MPALGPNTKVTLGAACAVVLSLGGIAWGAASYVGGKFDATNAKFDKAELAISALGIDLGAVKADRFTMTAASEHALRTALENPGLRIPDPRDPSKVFVVDVGRRTAQPSESKP